MARKKYEEISEHLELLILSGQLKPGDRLPTERDMMLKFTCGRSSVREALFWLQRQGLITVRAGAVPRVSKPTAEGVFAELSGAVRHYLKDMNGLRQLQDARTLLESALARHAAAQATDEDVDNIRTALEANRSARTREQFIQSDLDFHAAIAKASGNPIFVGINKALVGWLVDQRTTSAAAGAKTEEVIEQHEQIYLAIAQHDPDRAAAAMERHLAYVVQHYWQSVAPRDAIRKLWNAPGQL